MTATMTPARPRRWVSPLRYPGGKARMAPFLGEAFLGQWGLMDIEVWVEPFAGGAGAGLSLLDQGVVEAVWLVEKNPALADMWKAIIGQGERFAARVEATVPDMTLWEWARETVAGREAGEELSGFEAGYAAFILNRCSRSGIVAPNVGPQGGRNGTSRYTLTSRFEPASLAERIRHVHRLAAGGRMLLHEGDAVDYIASLNDSGVGDEVLLFVDPPYLREGNRLYAHGMTRQQHQALADALHATDSHWMLTYDDEPAVVADLYPEHRVLAYQIANTTNQQRVAWEYAVFSDNFYLPDTPLNLLPTGHSRWVRE